MPDMQPEPRAALATTTGSSAEMGWGDAAEPLAEPDLTANLVGGEAVRRSEVRGPFWLLGGFTLVLVVAWAGLAVIGRASTPAPAAAVATAAPAVATAAPAVVSTAAPTVAADAGKARIEDLLISGGCAISPSCPASVTVATLAHGIRITAGTPAVLQVDGHYSVLRMAMYVDGNSTPGGIFRITDISDPDLPMQSYAGQFSQTMYGAFQAPISTSARRVALSVDAGTVDLVGYAEAS